MEREQHPAGAVVDRHDCEVRYMPEMQQLLELAMKVQRLVAPADKTPGWAGWVMSESQLAVSWMMVEQSGALLLTASKL